MLRSGTLTGKSTKDTLEVSEISNSSFGCYAISSFGIEQTPLLYTFDGSQNDDERRIISNNS